MSVPPILPRSVAGYFYLLETIDFKKVSTFLIIPSFRLFKLYFSISTSQCQLVTVKDRELPSKVSIISPATRTWSQGTFQRTPTGGLTGVNGWVEV